MQSAIIDLSYKQNIRASLGTISHASSYVRASSESVCSEKMLDVVPLLRIVLQLFFRTLAIVPCTIVGYAVPVRGILFFPCSYGFLISPPTTFGVRFSLLTLRFRRDCLCHFRSRSIVSHHSTDGEILARSLSLPLLWGFTSSFQMELDAFGASLVEESFTLHLSLHSRPSLCTMKLFLLCALMSSVFMTFGYYGFCSIFPLQS